MKKLIFFISLVLVSFITKAQSTGSGYVNATIVLTDETGKIIGTIPTPPLSPSQPQARIVLYWKSGDATVITDSTNYFNYAFHKKQLVRNSSYYRKKIKRIK